MRDNTIFSLAAEVPSFVPALKARGVVTGAFVSAIVLDARYGLTSAIMDARTPQMVDAIKAGAAQCWALDIKTPRLFDGNREPGFKSYMQLKDMNIVLETAKEYDVPISGTIENTKLYQQMIDMGMGESVSYTHLTLPTSDLV